MLHFVWKVVSTSLWISSPFNLFNISWGKFSIFSSLNCSSSSPMNGLSFVSIESPEFSVVSPITLKRSLSSVQVPEAQFNS